MAGKFASILICGLAAELRNSQPQSVLRFCVFGGQGFFGLTKKAKNRLSGWMQMCISNILACGLYVAFACMVLEVGRSSLQPDQVFLLLFS